MVELVIDALPVDLELELWAHLAAAIGIQLSVDSVHLSVGISSDRADHLGVQGLEELVFFFLENVLLVVCLDLGGVWVFRTVCFERVVLSSPGCLWPGRMDDHEEVFEAHA